MAQAACNRLARATASESRRGWYASISAYHTTTTGRFSIENAAHNASLARSIPEGRSSYPAREAPAYRHESAAQTDLLRDIFPFDPITFDPSWLTSTVLALAQQMYDSRDFSAMSILADALQDAGCDNPQILDHCRGPGPHVRGCWVCDLCMNKT